MGRRIQLFHGQKIIKAEDWEKAEYNEQAAENNFVQIKNKHPMSKSNFESEGHVQKNEGSTREIWESYRADKENNDFITSKYRSTQRAVLQNSCSTAGILL